MTESENLPNKGSYSERILGSISRLLNVIFLNGSPIESISAKAYRVVHIQRLNSPRWIRYEKFVNRVFFWENHHTKLAYEYTVLLCQEYAEIYQRNRAWFTSSKI